MQLALSGNTPEEVDRAREWLRVAAMQGHEDAARYLVDVVGDEEFKRFMVEEGADAPAAPGGGLGETLAVEPPPPSCVRTVADSDIEDLTECAKDPAFGGNPVALAIYRQGLEIQGDLLEWDRAPRLLAATFEGNPEHMQWLFDVLDRARQGNLFYQTVLGRLHYKGAGLLEDRDQARQIWEKAAQAGYGPAAFLLADWNKYWGQGDDTPDRIVRYYDQAIQWGMPLASYWAGVFVRDGCGHIAADPAKAIRYWTESAERGYVLCQYVVGIAHAEGLDGTVNRNLARHWMRKAADQGFDLAKQYLVFNLGEPLPSRKAATTREGNRSGNAWAEILAMHGRGELGGMESKAVLAEVASGLPRLKISTDFGKVPIQKFQIGKTGAGVDGIVVRFDGVGFAGGKGGMENYQRSAQWVNREIRLLFAVPGTAHPDVTIVPVEYRYGVRFSYQPVSPDVGGAPWPHDYLAMMWHLYPHDVASGVDYVLLFIGDAPEPYDVYVGLAAYPISLGTEEIRANNPRLAAGAVSSDRGEMAFGLTRPVDQTDVLIDLACKRNVEGVAALAAQGTEINSVPTVFWAVRCMSSELDLGVLRGLIDLGADPTLRGFRDLTALHLVAEVMTQRTLYSESIDRNSAKAIEFLVASGCDVNAVGGDDESTPLMGATRGNGAPHAIRTLLRLGADPHMVSGRGKTAEDLIQPHAREMNLRALREGM
ncbi:MAG: SEL1-like repeat protein [Proteobacteria bacterium]|nr:SEL1-like repeat protein [Pseudomonadota bacterium]